MKPVIEALKGAGADDEILQAGATRGASADAIKSAVQRVVSMLVTEQSGKAVRVGESVVDNDMLQILKPGALDRVIKNLGGVVRRSAVKTVVPRGQTASLHLLNVMEDALGDTSALTVESKRENDIPSSPDALSNTRVFPTFVTRIGAYFAKFRQSMRASLNPSLRYGPEAQGVDTRTGSQIVAGSSSAVFGGGMDVKVQQAVDRLLAQVGDDISRGAMGTARVAGADVQLPQTLAKMVVEAIQTSSVLSEHTTAMGRMAGNTGPRGALESGDPIRKLLALFAGDLINQYRSTGGVSPDSAQNFMEQTVAPPQEHEVTLALTHALRLREKLTFKRDRADLDMVTASPHMASAYRNDSVAYSKQIQLLDEILKVSENPEEERALAIRRGQIAVPSSDVPSALTRDQALTVLLRAPIGSVPAMPDAVAPIVQKAQQVSAGLSESGLTVPMRPSYGTSPIQSLVDFYSSGQTQSLERFQPVPLTRQLDEVGDSAPTSGMEQKDIIAVISDAFGLSRQSGSRGNAITGVYYGARAADGAGGIKRGDDLDQALGGGYRTKNGLQSIVQAAAEMQSYGSTGIPLIDYARLATDAGRTEEDQSMFDQIKAKLPHLGSIGEEQLKELAALDTSMDPQELIKRVMTLAAPAIRKHLTDLVERQARAAGMDSTQIQELKRSGESGENVPAGFESAFRVLQMFDPNSINSADVNSEVNKAFSLFSGMLTDIVQPNESMPQLAARLLGRENRLEGTSPEVAQALDDTTGSFNLGRAGGEVANSESNKVVGNVYGRSITNQNNLAEALNEYDKIQSEIAELQNTVALKPEEADKITPIVKQKTDQLQQVREKLRIYRAKEPDTISRKFEALSTIVESKDTTAEEKTGAVRELALMQTIFDHTGRYVIDESQGFGSGTQEQRLAALLEHEEKVNTLENLKRQRAALTAGGTSSSRDAAVEALIEKSDVDKEIAAVTRDTSAGKTAGSSTAPIPTSDVKSSAPPVPKPEDTPEIAKLRNQLARQKRMLADRISVKTDLEERARQLSAGAKKLTPSQKADMERLEDDIKFHKTQIARAEKSIPLLEAEVKAQEVAAVQSITIPPSTPVDITDYVTDSNSGRLSIFPDPRAQTAYQTDLGFVYSGNDYAQNAIVGDDRQALTYDPSTETLIAAVSDGVSASFPTAGIGASLLTRAATRIPDDTPFTSDTIMEELHRAPLQDYEDLLIDAIKYPDNRQTIQNGISQAMIDEANQASKDLAAAEGRTPVFRDFTSELQKIRERVVNSAEEFQKYFPAASPGDRTEAIKNLYYGFNATLSAYRRRKNKETGKFQHDVVRVGDSPIISPELGITAAEAHDKDNKPSQMIATTGAEFAFRAKPDGDNPIFNQSYETDAPVEIALLSDAFGKIDNDDFMEDPSRVFDPSLIQRMQVNPKSFAGDDDISFIAVGKNQSASNQVIGYSSPERVGGKGLGYAARTPEAVGESAVEFAPGNVGKRQVDLILQELGVKQATLRSLKTQERIAKEIVQENEQKKTEITQGGSDVVQAIESATRDASHVQGQIEMTEKHIESLQKELEQAEQSNREEAADLAAKVEKEATIEPETPVSVISTPETIDEEIARVQGEITALESPATKLAREAAERGVTGQGQVAGRTYAHPRSSPDNPVTYTARRSSAPLTEDYVEETRKRYMQTGRIDVSPEESGSLAEQAVNSAVSEVLGIPIIDTAQDEKNNVVPDLDVSSSGAANVIAYHFAPGMKEPVVALHAVTGATGKRSGLTPVRSTVNEGESQWQAVARESMNAGIQLNDEGIVDTHVNAETGEAFFTASIAGVAPASTSAQVQGVSFVPLSEAIRGIDTDRHANTPQMQAHRAALVNLSEMTKSGKINPTEPPANLEDLQEKKQKITELEAQKAQLESLKITGSDTEKAAQLLDEQIASLEQDVKTTSDELSEQQRTLDLRQVVVGARTARSVYSKAEEPLMQFKEMIRVKMPAVTEDIETFFKDMPETKQKVEAVIASLPDSQLQNQDFSDQVDMVLSESNAVFDAQIAETDRKIAEIQNSPERVLYNKLKKDLHRPRAESPWTDEKEAQFYSRLQAYGLSKQDIDTGQPIQDPNSVFYGRESNYITWAANVHDYAPEDIDEDGKVKESARNRVLEEMAVNPELARKNLENYLRIHGSAPIPFAKEETDLKYERGDIEHRKTQHADQTIQAVSAIAQVESAKRHIARLEQETEAQVASIEIPAEVLSPVVDQASALGITVDSALPTRDQLRNIETQAASLLLQQETSEKPIRASVAEDSLTMGEIKEIRNNATHVLEERPVSDMVRMSYPSAESESILVKYGQYYNPEASTTFEAVRKNLGIVTTPVVAHSTDAVLSNPDLIEMEADAAGQRVPIVLLRSADEDQQESLNARAPLIFAAYPEGTEYGTDTPAESHVVYPESETPLLGGLSAYGEGMYFAITSPADVHADSLARAERITDGYITKAKDVQGVGTLAGVSPQRGAKTVSYVRKGAKILEADDEKAIESTKIVEDWLREVEPVPGDENFRIAPQKNNSGERPMASYVAETEYFQKTGEIPRLFLSARAEAIKRRYVPEVTDSWSSMGASNGEPAGVIDLTNYQAESIIRELETAGAPPEAIQQVRDLKEQYDRTPRYDSLIAGMGYDVMRYQGVSGAPQATVYNPAAIIQVAQEVKETRPQGVPLPKEDEEIAQRIPEGSRVFEEEKRRVADSERSVQFLNAQLEQQKQQLEALKARSEALKQEAAAASTPSVDVTAVTEESKRVADETVKVSADIKVSTEKIEKEEQDLDKAIQEAEKAVRLSQQRITALQKQAEGNAGGDEEVYFTVDPTGSSVNPEDKQILDRTSLGPLVRTRMTSPDTGESLFMSNTNVPALVRSAQAVDPTTVDEVLASMTDEDMRKMGMPAAKLPEEFNWDQPSTLPKEWQKKSGEKLTDEERKGLAKTPAEYDAELTERAAKARNTIQSNYYQEEYTAKDPANQPEVDQAAKTKRESTAAIAKFLETATEQQKQKFYEYKKVFDEETAAVEAVIKFPKSGDPATLAELQKKADEATERRYAAEELIMPLDQLNSSGDVDVLSIMDNIDFDVSRAVNALTDQHNSTVDLRSATRNPEYDDPLNQAVKDYYTTSSPDVKDAMLKSTPSLADRVRKIDEAEETIAAVKVAQEELYLPARVAAEKDATPEQLVARLFRQSEKAVQEYADEFTTVPEFTARDIVSQLVDSAAVQTSADAPATSPAVAAALDKTLTGFGDEGLPPLAGSGGTMGEKRKRRSPAATVKAVKQPYSAGQLKTARKAVRDLSGRTDLNPAQRRKLSAARQKLHAHAIHKLTTKFGDNKGVMQIANTIAGLTPPDWAADPVQSARVSAMSEAMSRLSPFALKKLQDVDLTNSVELDRLSKNEELRPIMEMLASQDISQALNFKSGTQEYDTARGVLDAIERAKASVAEDSGAPTDAEEKKKLFFDLETTYGTDASTRKIYQAASGNEGEKVEEMFAVQVPESAPAIQAVVADKTLTDDEKRKQIRELALKGVGRRPYVEGTDVNPKVIDRLVEHAMGGGTVYTQAEIKDRLKRQISQSSSVVGHNIADFDLPVVYDEAVPEDVQAKTEDTLLMSRQAYPGAHSLSDTYMAVTGNPLVDAHDASIDTRAVQEVYPSLATDEERRKLRARYLASKGIAPDSTVAKLADIPELESITDDTERQRAFEQVGGAYTYYKPLAEMQDFTKRVVRSGGVTRIDGADAKQQAELFGNMNKLFGTHIQKEYGDGQTVETLDDTQLTGLVSYITDTYLTPNAGNAVDGDYRGMAQLLAGKMGGGFKLQGFNRYTALDKFQTLDSRLTPGAMPGLSYDPTATMETVGDSIADMSAGKPSTVSTKPTSSTKPAGTTTTGSTTAGGGVRPPGGGSGLTTAASPDGSGGGSGSGFSSIGQATIDSLHAQNVAIEINGGTVNVHANFTDSAASKMTKSLVYISNKDGMNVNGDVTGMGSGGGGYRRVTPADRASFNVLEATKNDAAARLRDETDPAARDALRQSLVRASERTINEVIKPKAAKVLNPTQLAALSALPMGPEEALVSYNEMAQYNLNNLSTELATQEALPEGTSGRDTEIERLKAEIAAVEELINALTELNAIEQRVGSASGTRNVNSPYGTTSGTGTGTSASKYYSRKAKEDEQVFLQLARNSFDQSAGSMGIAGGTTAGSRTFLTDLTRRTATTMINSSGIQAPGMAADIAAIAATSPEVQSTYDDASKSLADFSGKVGGTITDVADDLFTVVSGLEALKAALTPLAATSPQAAAALAVVQTAIDETSAAGKEQRGTAGVIETDNRKKVSLVEEQMQAAASRPGFFAGGRREREMRQIQEGYIRDTFGKEGLDALMHRGRIRAYTATGKRVDMAQATVQEQRDTVDRLQKQGINITAEDMTGIARMSGRVEQTKRSAPMGDKLFYAASKIRDVGTVFQTVTDVVSNLASVPTMAANMIGQFASTATGSNRVMTTARGLALSPENYQAALGAADLQRKQFGGSLTSNLSQVSSFIPLSNAYGVDISKTVKVARKLAAFDPAQGMEGASIAIKEFLSGNVSSLSRRFEINRSALSKINTGDADQMLDSLDQVLSGMGVTDRLIDEQAASMATKYDKIVGNLESAQIGITTSLVEFITPTLESLFGAQSYIGKNLRERSLDSLVKESITSYGDDALTDKDTGLASVKLFGSTALFSSSMDEVIEAANQNMMEKAGEYNAATGVTTKIAPYRLVGNMKPEERRKLQSAAINNMLGGMNQTQAIMQAMRDNQLDYNISSETNLQRESLSELRKSNPAEYAKRVAGKQTQLEKFKAQATKGMSEGSKLNKGNIERQVDIDTYDVRLADSGDVVRVRLPGIDAPESGTKYDMRGRAVAADVLKMKRSDIGRTLNNQGPIKEGVEVSLVGDLKDKDDSGRVVASILSKDGKNLSVELVAAGEAAVSFIDGMDVSTKYALQMSQKLSADLGLGSINKSAFQVGMGGTPVISDEVRSQYFNNKYLSYGGYGLGGLGTSAGVGGAAGYGALAGLGALGGGGSLAALTGAVGLVGVGGAVGLGAAVAGAGYYGYAKMADNADESPEKMRELLKMQAAQDQLDLEAKEFSVIAEAANDTVGAKTGFYVGGLTQEYIDNNREIRTARQTRNLPFVNDGSGWGSLRRIRDPKYTNLEYDPEIYVETEKQVRDLRRQREVVGRSGNIKEVEAIDKKINYLVTEDFKVEAYIADLESKLKDDAIKAASPGFAEAIKESSAKAQENYASSSDFMKRVLAREVVNPITNQREAYGAFEAQTTALETFAQEGGDAVLLGYTTETQEEQDKLKSGTIAFKANEKVLGVAEKYGLSVDAREFAEVGAQPLRDEKAKLEEDRNEALAMGATFRADQLTTEIAAKQAEIDAITFDDAEWAKVPAHLRRYMITVDALASASGDQIAFASAEAAKQLNSMTDYQVQAKAFTDSTMDRAFQRRQQRFETTTTAFARQAIMGLGKASAPDLTARELGSSGGAGLVIDNTVQARAQNMMLSSGFMPENPQYNQHIIKELTTAQQAAVEEQLNIARTNRQVALSNAPEAQLYKSGFTNFVMAMNVAGATAEDLGRSFMNTMNLMSEGNPRYGLDLAQQMTGFSYDSMIGMQLRPRGNDEKGNPISSLNGLNGQPYSGSGPMVMPYTSGPRGTIAYSRDMMAVNAQGVRENALGIAPSQWQQFVSNATNANAELQRRGMSNAMQERDLNKNHQRNLEDIARNGMRQLESIHLNYTRNMQQLTMQADLVKGTTRANAARSIAMAAIDPTRKEQISSQYWAQDRYFQHIGQGDSVNFLKDSSNIAAITAIDPSLSADISALETTNAAYENSAITDPNRQDLQNAKRATIEPILTKLRGLIETETDPIKRASLQKALVQLSPDASRTIAGQNENDKWLKQNLGDAITETQLGQQISDQEFQNKFRPLDIANDAASGAEAARSQDPLALLNYSRSSETMYRGFGQADKALNDTKNSLAGLTGTAHMFEETSQTAIGQIAAGIGSATQSVLYSVDDFETSFQQQMEDALRNFERQRLDMIQAFADAAVEIASIVPEEMIPIMQATSAFMNTQRQAELLWLSGRTDEANALAYQGMLKLGEVVYGEGKGKEYADKYSQNFQDMADVAARDVPQGDLGKFAVKTEDGWALLVKETKSARVYDRPPPNKDKETLQQGDGAFVGTGGKG